jgi:hypothetical protein
LKITTPGRRRPCRGVQSLGQHLRCSRPLLLLVVERAAEQHDMRLRPVDRVVHPPAALLHADGTPLVLRNSPHTETPIRQTTREHDQHECRWNSRRLLPRRGGGSWGGAWRPRAGGRRACMRRRKGIELRFCHRRNGNEQRSDRGEGGSLLPVLVGVIEVLLGVLDLTHVHHHHFSISFSAGRENPKIQSKIPTQPAKSRGDLNKLRLTEGNFEGGGREKSKDLWEKGNARTSVRRGAEDAAVVWGGRAETRGAWCEGQENGERI